MIFPPVSVFIIGIITFKRMNLSNIYLSYVSCGNGKVSLKKWHCARSDGEVRSRNRTFPGEVANMINKLQQDLENKLDNVNSEKD